ncbi:hypothetical protein BX666DRAFT_1967436 [Dichotomocladium elegans]|nr:hypothetical protein BX666DRAFT_1967436 [Dichotomocladium elegans]
MMIPATATSSITTAPLAGELSKMTLLPFGRTRWHSRYFVLLDSQLRIYKDEHAVSPTSFLDLSQIRGAVAISVDSHLYCIRLEPRSDARAKPLTVACSSQKELEMWLKALRIRIDRLYVTPPSSPKRSVTAATLTWLRKSNTSIDKHSNKSQPAQDETFYHAITHDECILRPRPRKAGPAPSLSRRRGIVLPPIIIESSPFQLAPTESDDGASTPIMSDSSSSTLAASPSGGLLTAAPLPPHPLPRIASDDRGLQSLPSLCWPKKEEAEISPSFLYYKERFHLF